MRIDLLEPDGEFVRRITLTTALVTADVVLPDGRLVGHFRRLGDTGEPSGEGVPIHLIPLDDTEPELLYTAWELPEEAEDETSFSRTSEGGILTRLAAGRAFEPRLDFDVLSDGRLALIDSIGYRVKLIDLGGSVTGTIERPIAPLPVTAAIMEAERDRYRDREARIRERATQLNVQIEQEGVEERAFADEVPVLYGLKVDWDDRIWVDRRGPAGDGDGPTDIVTPGGDYIGTLPPEGLRTPDAFGPDGLLAYIERDAMDVPAVRVVRLVALEPKG